MWINYLNNYYIQNNITYLIKMLNIENNYIYVYSWQLTVGTLGVWVCLLVCQLVILERLYSKQHLPQIPSGVSNKHVK